MNPPHLLIVGCGDIGTRVAQLVMAWGWQVSAVRRNPALLPSGVRGVAGDYSVAGGLSGLAGLTATVCLFTPLPASRDEVGYERGFRDSVDEIARSGVLAQCERLLYVSSTRVYAEQTGGWVDEHAATTCTDPLGMAILDGEARARHWVPTTVVRPAGVYGALPAMLIDRVVSGAGSADPDRISNRIHRDDLAMLLATLARRVVEREWLPDTLNAADDEPAPIGEVEAWLAAELGVSCTPGPGGKSVRGNRRVSNALLRSLGFALQYPSWREGYAALLRARSVTTVP